MNAKIATTALCLTLALSAIGQKLPVEPLEAYARKIIAYPGFRINEVYRSKDMFTDDTIATNITIEYLRPVPLVRRSFLKITDHANQLELLLMNDSVWSYNIRTTALNYMGDKSTLKSHGLFKYFPANALLLDTSIFKSQPFWTYLPKRDHFQKIQLNLTETDTEFATEAYLTLNMKDTSFWSESVVSQHESGETTFIEKRIENMSALTASEVSRPLYLATAQAEPVDEQKAANQALQKQPSTSIDTDTIRFRDLSGNTVTLPDSGIAFFDFWYVGCLPCLKASPIVEALSAEYKNRISFYCVNDFDTDLQKITRFKEKMKISMPLLLCDRKSFESTFKGRGYPRFLLLNLQSGEVMWIHSSYSDTLKEKVANTIDSFLE